MALIVFVCVSAARYSRVYICAPVFFPEHHLSECLNHWVS